MLGLAFHPGFNDPASPGFRKFYTYTSEPVSGPADFTVPKPVAFDHQSVVAEWQASAGNPDIADPATRREVLRVDEPQANHNGGKLAFRPGEPYLYISLGDGGACERCRRWPQPRDWQRPGSHRPRLEKSSAFDPLDPSPHGRQRRSDQREWQVSRADDNPFINSSTALHEIYAYGLRNPFRFSFDAATDRLIVGDVGQKNVEEVDLVEAGKNYGWNRKEGCFLFRP